MNWLITVYFTLIYRYDSTYKYSYTNVSCSDHRNYKKYGQLHLLQCQGSTQQQQCSQDPVYLVCGE